MTTAKATLLDHAAQAKLTEGINFVAEPVKRTLGPGGKLVIIQGNNWFEDDIATKDGVTVAKALVHPDAQVDRGCFLVKKVATKAVNSAGDGTTTATVLAQAIVKEGNKMIAAGMHSSGIRKGIGKGVETVISSLKEMSREISSHDEIKQIGTVSANGDEEVGEKIADAMEKVGKEGILTVEESRGEDFEVEVVQGMRFDKGYISPLLSNNLDKRIVEMHSPWILVLKKNVPMGKPLENLMNKILMHSTRNSILIIAESYEQNALEWIVLNKMRVGLKICAVTAPLYGNFMQDTLEDIAILTQAKVFSDELGIDLQNIEEGFLGGAEKVIVTNEHTTIVNGYGQPEAIEARCQAIREEIQEKKKDRLVTALEQRLARLTGGIAVLRVGGITEVAMKERRDRVEDAMYATKAAVEEGIVPGGGLALFNTRKALDDLLNDLTLSQDIRGGISIVRKSIEAPLCTIVDNAGQSPEVVLNAIELSDNPNYGYDACNMRYVDMIEAGIIDPTKVVRIAIQCAGEIAGIELDTGAIVTHDKSAHTEQIQTALFGKK